MPPRPRLASIGSRPLALSITFGGSLYHASENPPPGSQQITFDSALNEAVYQRTKGQVTELMTWREVIHTVADKLAVHADASSPVLLDRLDALFTENGHTWGYRTVLDRVGRIVTHLADDIGPPSS